MSRIKSASDARKLASKEFRARGAEVTEDTRLWRTWRFPDHYTVTLPHSFEKPQILAKLREVQQRYPIQAPRKSRAGYENRPGKPQMDIERVVASTHAKERLALMQAQARVEFAEVLHCLRIPERVLWSRRHESWTWVRGRLAVAVVEKGDRLVIATVLWSSEELFEEFPREVGA